MGHASPRVVLFGGPAGAGKSTLAAAWCSRRPRAVHLQLDEIRSLIVSGLADPQISSDERDEQFLVSAKACCALAREFVAAGYDIAIDDVLYPGEAFEVSWGANLEGLDYQVVIVRPSLDETLRRAADRRKDVPEHLIREHHKITGEWPDTYQVDTTELTVEASLELVESVLAAGGMKT